MVKFMKTSVLLIGFGSIIWAAAAEPQVPGERPVDPLELEQRALNLLIEEQALRRRRSRLAEAFRSEIDPQTYSRFFNGGEIHTGIYVEEPGMRVIRVVTGSPGHAAGIRENDQVLEINDTAGGDGPDASARLFWAFRRLNPGDLASITFLRDGRRHLVQVPVISQEQLEEIELRERVVVDPPSESQVRESERRQWIKNRQYQRLHGAFAESIFGFWDGLVLIRGAAGLPGRQETEVGVLVVDSADSDHPLRVGDVIARVGDNTPADAGHAVQLLYGYHEQGLVPLLVARGGFWLELEVPYPRSERQH